MVVARGGGVGRRKSGVEPPHCKKDERVSETDETIAGRAGGAHPREVWRGVDCGAGAAAED